MKTFQITFILLLSIVFSAGAQDVANMETRIHQAYSSAWQGSGSKLEAIVKELSDKGTTDQQVLYWKAYAMYRLAIYQSATKNTGAEATIDKGIESLNNIKKKTSENYALLSCMTGFSIQFNQASAAFLGPKAGKYAQKSISLNQDNPRGHFAIAMNDFYTPAMFGGGDMVEKHLKKALSFNKPLEGTPTWSMDEAYELLVRFYIREEKTDEAKLFCRQGMAKFPYHNPLQKHAKTLGLSK